jgi:hypothetical protein
MCREKTGHIRAVLFASEASSILRERVLRSFAERLKTKAMPFRTSLAAVDSVSTYYTFSCCSQYVWPLTNISTKSFETVVAASCLALLARCSSRLALPEDNHHHTIISCVVTSCFSFPLIFFVSTSCRFKFSSNLIKGLSVTMCSFFPSLIIPKDINKGHIYAELARGQARQEGSPSWLHSLLARPPSVRCCSTTPLTVAVKLLDNLLSTNKPCVCLAALQRRSFQASHDCTLAQAGTYMGRTHHTVISASLYIYIYIYTRCFLCLSEFRKEYSRRGICQARPPFTFGSYPHPDAAAASGSA